VLRLAIIAALLALSGCTTAPEGVTLPPLPAWQEPRDPRPLVGLYVQSEARRMFPGVPVSAADVVYTRVSRPWLDRYLTWTWEAAKAAGVRYTPESFDCEDFSRLFDSIAGLAAAKAGVHMAPLIARIVVQWDGTARHELVAVATDAGLVVVEPQPDAGPFRVWPLEEYARRRPVLAITLGDFNP
jgi:hypothetical protein